MTGFVYKWINQINEKWYIGSRKGTINDGYMHSSEVLAAAMHKYGVENFSRKILFTGDYKKDQIRSVVEAKFLRDEDAANNPMSYNRTNITGPDCFSEITREKMREAKLNISQSPVHIQRRALSMQDSMQGNTNAKHLKGFKQTDEHIQKRATKMRGKLKGPQQIIICPRCGTKGGNAMHRWHFENCRN